MISVPKKSSEIHYLATDLISTVLYACMSAVVLYIEEYLTRSYNMHKSSGVHHEWAPICVVLSSGIDN